MEVITQEIKATEVHGQATRDKTQCTQGTEKPDGLQTVPHSHLAGKESTCNAGDPGSIPGSGKSAAEGIGYPLQYSFFFPCGSAGKESAYNVGDLSSVPGWENLLEKGKATYSSTLAWRIP